MTTEETVITVHRLPSLIGGFLRMLAHFDSLDGDEEPDEVQPRYELLFPEDSYPCSPLHAAYVARLEEAMLCGSAV